MKASRECKTALLPQNWQAVGSRPGVWELKHGEPDNEVQVKMLARFCERAARGDEAARVVLPRASCERRAE